MTASLPLALRQRAYAAWESGDTIQDVADTFSVGSATLKRWIRRMRETGSLEPAPRLRGRAPFATPERLAILRELVAQNRDWNQVRLAEAWSERCGAKTSQDTVGRALLVMGIRRGRRHGSHGCVTCGACAERVKSDQQGWMEATRTIENRINRFVREGW